MEILVDINCEADILGYFMEGHIEKKIFIDELLNSSDICADEVSIEDIKYRYAKWIPNPSYEDDPDILDISQKAKEGYFPITIYE